MPLGLTVSRARFRLGANLDLPAAFVAGAGVEAISPSVRFPSPRQSISNLIAGPSVNITQKQRTVARACRTAARCG